MTGNLTYFSHIDENVVGNVKFGDDTKISIKGKGTILIITNDGNRKTLPDVYYVPDLKSNIISLGQATELGCDVRMKKDVLTLCDQKGKLILTTKRSMNRLYKVRINIMKNIGLLQLETSSDYEKWHARLGHISSDTIKLMIQKESVFGIPKIEFRKEICPSCLLGKHSRHNFPKATMYRAEKRLELVHGDLCGPITPCTPSSKKYIFVLIDDFSRFMWTFLLRDKNEALGKFKTFKTLTETETGEKLKTFRTDRGGEFVSKEFMDFCSEQGISRHLSAPYSPQQNGVVERRNRTLMEMCRSMIKHMSLPNFMWGEAARHATYLINRVSSRSIELMTPYEKFKLRKPNVAHIKVFGCKCYAKIQAQLLRKLDDRTRELVHLGTEPGSKAYRLYDPISKKIIVSRDVVFDENTKWKWNDTEDSGEQSGSFVTENYRESIDEIDESNTRDVSSTGDSSNELSDIHEREVIHDSDDDNHEREVIHDGDNNNHGREVFHGDVRRSTRERRSPKYLDDYVLLAKEESEKVLSDMDDEPWCFEEAEKSEKWLSACKEELKSIERNKTWSLEERPVGAKPIGLKWVFKLKKNSDGSINKHKARLVAKGYVQRHGIDYEEVFAPVARMETIRLLFGISACNGWIIHHLDVKTAFLYGELKELVYVEQPEGFISKGNEDKVYKLHKALYGLKQVPRAWNHKLHEVLCGLDFTRCKKEPSMYKRQDDKESILVAVYVDDLLVTESCERLVKDFKKGMETKFEMSDLGKLSYYLGIEVKQSNGGIVLKQERYASRVLEEAGMKESNAALVPMDPGLKLSKSSEESDIDKKNFRRIIGCLRYLLHTRPDLSYSVGVLSRYMQDPKTSHGAALKHILRYLKGTKSFGLSFTKSDNKRLCGYSDSSYSVDIDDGKSTTGHVFFFGNSPISWCSTKQEIVDLSSCEAEFMAATEAAKQAVWLQELLGEIVGREAEKVVLYVDNKSAIALSKNHVFHGRSKHIHTRYHFIRECVEKELITVEHIPGNGQRADILTKVLGKMKFKEMREILGVQDTNRNSKFEGGIVEALTLN